MNTSHDVTKTNENLRAPFWGKVKKGVSHKKQTCEDETS